MKIHHKVFFLLPLLFLPAVSAVAREIHYGAVTDQKLLQCDAAEWRGQRDQSRPCYRALLKDNNAPAVRAEAAWALGDLKAANMWFQTALSENPTDATIRIRWGELYLQTYQYQEALNLFNEALELESQNAFASVGIATALAQRFEAPAADFLTTVLNTKDTPPGARLAALLLSAYMALEDGDVDRATAILRDADTAASQARLPTLEINALRAASDLLQHAEAGVWIAAALEGNPLYGDIYAIPAHFAWIKRQYREAIKLYEKAIEVQPDHWPAHLELGVNLLRRNQVTRARRHLAIAYGGDPYNPKTVNTLRLLDTFDNFSLVTFPAESPDKTPTLQLRLHEDEREILTPYTRQLATEALAGFSKRYRFTTEEPVVIEIYPNHEDFIVRTTGMPGLSILGVAFGYLVAMDSPSARPQADYHWGTTLWHELAHVYTLEMTGHRVPRWFSEGISVFEEWRSGPVHGIRIPIEVYEAIAHDEFLPVAELDRGFIRPSYAGQVQVSYMQAGLICEFIDRQYGFDAILDLLEQFGDGADTPRAIQTVLDVSAADFDGQFEIFVDHEFGELVDNLDGWRAAQQATLEHLAQSDWAATIAGAQQAIAIFPAYVEADSPYIALASAYAETGAADKQLETLEIYWRKGGYAPQSLRSLADKLYAARRPAVAVAVLQSLNYVIPFDTQLHSQLGDWLLELDRAQDALNEYEVMLAMTPHDLAAAHYRMARAHHSLDHSRETRNHLLTALDIAPHYRAAQKLLLEISRTN